MLNKKLKNITVEIKVLKSDITENLFVFVTHIKEAEISDSIWTFIAE